VFAIKQERPLVMVQCTIWSRGVGRTRTSMIFMPPKLNFLKSFAIHFKSLICLCDVTLRRKRIFVSTQWFVTISWILIIFHGFDDDMFISTKIDFCNRLLSWPRRCMKTYFGWYFYPCLTALMQRRENKMLCYTSGNL